MRFTAQSSSEGEPVFHKVRGPTAARSSSAARADHPAHPEAADPHRLHLIEEQGMRYLAEAESDRVLTPEADGGLHLSHCAGAPGGAKVLSLQTVPSRAADSTQPGWLQSDFSVSIPGLPPVPSF
jgi:hypothetical protein